MQPYKINPADLISMIFFQFFHSLIFDELAYIWVMELVTDYLNLSGTR